MSTVGAIRRDLAPFANSCKQLFELSPEAQILIDPHTDLLLAANRAAKALFRAEMEELLALRPSTLMADGLSGLIVFTQGVLAQGSGWTRDLSCRRLDGQPLTLECHAAKMNDPRSEGLVLLALRDTEEQHQREAHADANAFVQRGLSEWRHVEVLFREIEQENQLILRAAGEGIYGVNAEGETTFVNPAAERMLGYASEELVGKNMHTMLHHTHVDGRRYPVCDCPIYAAFKDGEVHQVENEVFWRKDGSAFPVEYTSTPIREHGTLVGAVVVFRDVSDRKEAEDRLHTALQELEQLKKRLEMENAYLQEEMREEYNYNEIVGRSQALRETIGKIEMVAPTDATVLITGESGTGKELIARAIHQSSERSDRPLIRVNCAAVPRELFESEFFGHVKGAFTGAVRDRAGRFELANGGTLFLDEVGELPLELQGKLLRVLQEGQFERVGSDQTVNVNVRIIAATNRNLEQESAQGRFRQDLYFRLNVFPIPSASLRERPEDIPLLASHFLASAGRRFGREGLRLSQGDVKRLRAYDWPGNVRELENVIERAVIISRDGTLRMELPDAPRPAPPPRPTTEPVRDRHTPEPSGDSQFLSESARRQRDREAIMRALEVCDGKVFGQGGAAELLGLKPTTLASRIKRWGIPNPRRP